MMEIQRLVTGAKLGNDDDFGALVRLYQRRLLASVLAVVKDRSVAEDLVQEAFIRAWSGLATLRSAEAFPAWLGAIGRNLARSHCRLTARGPGICFDTDPEGLVDFRSLDLGSGELLPGWARIRPLLSADQRVLVELRHGAGLSLRQIGAVLGLPEQRVKSRMYQMRRKLEKALDQPLPEAPSFLEEKIMDKIETLRLGAHVFERLSLAAQTEFALAVLAGRPLNENVLAEIGRVDRGTEFLALYGPSMALAEMIGFLNYVDRFTECRLVEHLEVIAPVDAETLKQNFFVFEDVILFDPAAVRLFVETADRDLLVMALGGTELRVRQHVLDALTPGDRGTLEGQIGKADGDRNLVRAAQEFMVKDIKDLEQAGRLIVRRPAENEGQISITTST